MALLDESGLKYLWSQLKTKFAMASHTHDAATKSTAGMMSAADKTKLDGIAEKLTITVIRQALVTSIFRLAVVPARFWAGPAMVLRSG